MNDHQSWKHSREGTHFNCEKHAGDVCCGCKPKEDCAFDNKSLHEVIQDKELMKEILGDAAREASKEQADMVARANKPNEERCEVCKHREVCDCCYNTYEPCSCAKAIPDNKPNEEEKENKNKPMPILTKSEIQKLVEGATSITMLSQHWSNPEWAIVNRLPDIASTAIKAIDDIDWMRQTIHRAHHEGPLEDCKQSICRLYLDTYAPT